MRKEYIKVMFLCLIFFCFYGFFVLNNFNSYGKVNNSQDFFFHFNKANGTIQESDYPPLFHFISSIFSFNEIAYYFFGLALIVFVIPFLIFHLTKNFYSVLVYFVLTNLPHLMLSGSTFPQALMIIFFLLYLIEKKLLIPLCILASFTHKSGLALFIGVFIIELIVLFYDNFKLKFDSVFSSVGFLIGSKITGIKSLTMSALVSVPLPLIYFSRKAFSKPFYLLLALLGFGVALYTDVRGLWLTQISLILNFEQPKIKKGFLLLVFLYCFFYLINHMISTIKLITLN